MDRLRLTHLLSAALLVAVMAGSAAAAPQVWSGRTFSFSKAANANPALAANQDRITSSVWITRGATQGIYNAFSESISGGTYGNSPAGTEWATGDAANYASLTFDTWVNWAANFPPGTVGVNACVHLIADDIYLDIRFDSWASGALGGGAFSYTRAVAPAPTAIRPGTWGSLKSLYR